MEKNNHLIVKRYLQDHSLVASNITSFNDFIERRMQEITGRDFQGQLKKGSLIFLWEE